MYQVKKLFTLLVGGSKLSYYFNVKSKNCIITATAHDSTSNNLATIAQPIQDVLTKVQEKLKENTSILVLICQMRKIFGIFPRNHFTFLEIKKDANGKITAHHHDSKGILGWFYSLSKIKSAIQNTFGKQVKLGTSYHGHQGIKDNNNCGRFVISYIKQKENGENIQNPQLIESNFEDINSQIFNEIVKDLKDKFESTTLSQEIDVKKEDYMEQGSDKKQSFVANLQSGVKEIDNSKSR